MTRDGVKDDAKADVTKTPVPKEIVADDLLVDDDDPTEADEPSTPVDPTPEDTASTLVNPFEPVIKTTESGST